MRPLFFSVSVPSEALALGFFSFLGGALCFLMRAFMDLVESLISWKNRSNISVCLDTPANNSSCSRIASTVASSETARRSMNQFPNTRNLMYFPDKVGTLTFFCVATEDSATTISMLLADIFTFGLVWFWFSCLAWGVCFFLLFVSKRINFGRSEHKHNIL